MEHEKVLLTQSGVEKLEQERDKIITQVKSYSVVLDAKWRFGTVLFTAYIRH